MSDTYQDILLIYRDLNWQFFEQLKEAVCSIDMENIDFELSEMSNVYTKWSGLLKLAKREVDKAEIEFTNWVALTRKQERNVYTGKPTDAYLTEYIESHSEYVERRKQVLDKEYKYKLLQSITEGLHQKRDALIQISSNKRAEAKIFN